MVAFPVIQALPWTEIFQLGPKKVMSEDRVCFIFSKLHHGNPLLSIKRRSNYRTVYLYEVLFSFSLLVALFKTLLIPQTFLKNLLDRHVFLRAITGVFRLGCYCDNKGNSQLSQP